MSTTDKAFSWTFNHYLMVVSLLGAFAWGVSFVCGVDALKTDMRMVKENVGDIREGLISIGVIKPKITVSKPISVSYQNN